MMRRTLAPIVLLLALATAGCGSGSGPTVATVNSAAPTAGAGSTADSEASPLKFSQCMRAQGLAWFPDPEPGGGLKVRVPDGVSQGVVDKAEKACQKVNPGANENRTRLSADDLAKLRKVAQCIRDHGFAKYPDPDASGTTRINSGALGIDPDDPAFDRARQECQKYAPPRKNNGTS
jgi:hypothetical protein